MRRACRMRHIAEIDRHQAKAAALQKQVGDAQRLLERAKVGRRTSDLGRQTSGARPRTSDLSLLADA